MLRPSISIWEPTQFSAGTYTANTVHELREDVKVISFILLNECRCELSRSTEILMTLMGSASVDL